MEGGVGYIGHNNHVSGFLPDYFIFPRGFLFLRGRVSSGQLLESEADTGEGPPRKSHNLMTRSLCICRRCDRELGTWLKDLT